MDKTSNEKIYENLCIYVRQTKLLSSTQCVLEWDERTRMPSGGGEYRAEQVAYLAGLIHKRQTDPQVGEWLARLQDSRLADDRHSQTGTVIH